MDRTLRLPTDFETYRAYSRLFKSAVSAIAPRIEDHGIDEMYIDLTEAATEKRTRHDPHGRRRAFRIDRNGESCDQQIAACVGDIHGEEVLTAALRRSVERAVRLQRQSRRQIIRANERPRERARRPAGGQHHAVGCIHVAGGQRVIRRREQRRDDQRELPGGVIRRVDRVGRVIVNEDLTIPAHPEVQVIGDLANFSHQTGKPLPGVSAVAMQQGRHAARNVLAMIKGGKPQRFRYWDKGSMATIGRNKAVADLNIVHLSGLPAWIVWLFVHVLFLVGFRNRLAVLFQWAWAYFTFNKGARLITRNFQAEQRPPA